MLLTLFPSAVKWSKTTGPVKCIHENGPYGMHFKQIALFRSAFSAFSDECHIN